MRSKTKLRLGLLGYALFAMAVTVALYTQNRPKPLIEVPMEDGRLVCADWEVISAIQVPNGVRLGGVMYCTRYEREKKNERTEAPRPPSTEKGRAEGSKAGTT